MNNTNNTKTNAQDNPFESKATDKNLQSLFGSEQPFGAFNRFGSSQFWSDTDTCLYEYNKNMEKAIKDYEKEIKRTDSNTREDLKNIDIALGRMSYPELEPHYTWGWMGNNRAFIKKSINNIIKRDRKKIYTLTGLVICLSATLITKRNKK